MGISLSGLFPHDYWHERASTPNTFSTQTRYCCTCYNSFTLPALELLPQACKQFATVSSYIIEQNMCISLPHQAHLKGLRRQTDSGANRTALLWVQIPVPTNKRSTLGIHSNSGDSLSSLVQIGSTNNLLKGFCFFKIRHSRVFFKKGMIFLPLGSDQ